MFALVLACLIVVLFTVISYYRHDKDIFSPALLHCIAWGATFTTGLFCYDGFYELNFYMLTLWLIWFLPSIMIMLIPTQVVGIVEGKGRRYYSYWWIVVALCILLLFRIYSIGNSGPASFLLNLRLATIGVTNDETLGWITRLYPAIFALFIYASIFEYRTKNYYALLFWLLLYAVATMGKFAIITPFVVWVCSRNYTNHRIKLRVALWLLLLCGGAMMLLHFSRAGDGDSSSLKDVLGLYLYSPIIALGHLSGENLSGREVFRFFYAITDFLGLSNEAAVETILPYVYIPVPTNVYTAMRPFFVDFGFFGLFLGSILYGIVYALLYRGIGKGSLIMLMIYLALIVSLPTQVLGETLITNFSGNLQIVVYCIIVFTVIKNENRY